MKGDSHWGEGRGATTGRVRRFLENVLTRTSAEKTLFLASVSFACDALWIPILAFAMPSFRKVPAIEFGVLEDFLLFFIAIGVVFGIFSLVGIPLRKRGYRGRLYSYGFFFSFALLALWAVHILGTFSSPGLMLYMTLPSLVLLVYGQREGLFSVITATLILLAIAWGEYTGHIAYAPVANAGLEKLYLQPPVFLSFLLAALTLTAVLFALVWIVRGQLVQKEGALGATLASLGATRDRLVRAGRSVEVGEMAVGVVREMGHAAHESRTLALGLLEELSGRSRVDLSGRELSRFEEDLEQIASLQRRTARALVDLERLSHEQSRELEKVNLNALVSDALSQVRRRHAGREITIEIDLSATKPQVQANGIELLWALDHVIDYALSSLPQGAAQLLLRSRDGVGEVLFECHSPSGVAPLEQNEEGLGFVHRVVARLSGRIARESGTDGTAILEIALPRAD